MPKPDDHLAEYNRFGDMEGKALGLFATSAKQWKAHQITGQQYADILEKQILPQWRAEREAMEKLKVAQDQAATKQLLVEYLADREQSWQLTVDGLRADDANKIRQGAQKEAEAEKVAAQLRGR